MRIKKGVEKGGVIFKAVLISVFVYLALFFYIRIKYQVPIDLAKETNKVADNSKVKPKRSALDNKAQVFSCEEDSSIKGQEFSMNEVNFASAKLSKGAFGVPFGASLNEVFRWCDENKVVVLNNTKQQLEEKSQNIANQINEEKENPGVNKNTKDQIKNILEELKNPCFYYYGNGFLLNKVFKDGEVVVVDGIKRICTDKRITDSTYSLKVAPSEDSKRLRNNSLDNIEIFLKRDDYGRLFSYATVSCFQNIDKEDLGHQYSLIIGVLNAKYGEPLFLTKPKGMGIDSVCEDNAGVWKIYRMTGIDSLNYITLMWKKNIIILSESMFRDSNTPNKSFYLIYYEPNAAKKILESYRDAIEDFRHSFAKEEVKQNYNPKDNF